MKKLTVIKPESKAKKPFKTGGDWLRGSNFEKLSLSPSEIIATAKRTHKVLGIANCISQIAVTDRGDYYTVSCC